VYRYNSNQGDPSSQRKEEVKEEGGRTNNYRHWNQEEHRLFLKHKNEFDRNWTIFAMKITTRTPIQINRYAIRYYSNNKAAAKERKKEENEAAAARKKEYEAEVAAKRKKQEKMKL